MTQRELKFRVWDGKDMREPPPLNEWDMEDGEFWVEYCDNPIMQFTGLQDKNGKDIYEWDLISNRSGRVCRVEWHQPTGAWDATPIGSKGDSLWFMASNWNRHIEVIGNIHENPELLK